MRFVVWASPLLARLVMLPETGVYAATIEFSTISVSDGSYSIVFSDDKELTLPALSRGDIVEINGVGDTYGGLYYVDSVTHTFDQNGYRQSFKLKRNATGSGDDRAQTDESLILSDHKFSFSSTVVDDTTNLRLQFAPIRERAAISRYGPSVVILLIITILILTRFWKD